MVGKDLLGALVGLTHDALDLDVDTARRLLGVILMVRVVATQEHLVVGLAEHLGSQLLAHAEARDHLSRHLGRALEVVARAGRDVIAHELLRHAASKEHGEVVEHLVFRREEVILLGTRHGVA